VKRPRPARHVDQGPRRPPSRASPITSPLMPMTGGLFKAKVAASETYHTSLEQHPRDALGVRFVERPGSDPGKRPIREIVGVVPRLNERWSTRRAQINVRRGELGVQFQAEHGRPPTPVEALHLAQQATLETRDAQHEPRSLAEQRTTWMNEASAVLGGRSGVASMVATALTPAAEPPTPTGSPLVLGCSLRSRRPAPGRPRPCAPLPSPGPKTAARCSASPRPHFRTGQRVSDHRR
jgi:hypothetical protein